MKNIILKPILIARLTALLLFLAEAQSVWAQSISVQSLRPWIVPTQGGTTAHNGNFQLTYTAGQQGAVQGGTMRNGNLMLTTGFQQPIIPVPPVVASLASCSGDTNVVFQFTNVRAGLLGDSVQYAHNKTFTGAVTIASGGAIYDTVTPPVGSSPHIDTLWLRSLNSYEHTVSSAVITTATINPLPTATITPADTTVPGNATVVLQASGGASYFWPQFRSTASSETVILLNDSSYYFVEVKSTAGCPKQAIAKVRRHLPESPRTIGTNFSIFNGVKICQKDTVALVADNSTVAYGCEDFMIVTPEITDSVPSDFQLHLELPEGFIPDTFRQNPPQSWDFNTGELSWSLTNFGDSSVTAYIYFDCNARGQQDSLLNPYADSILIYVSDTAHSHISFNTQCPSVVWPFVKISSHNMTALPGTMLIDSFTICADSGSIDNLQLIPYHYADSLYLSTDSASHIPVGLSGDTVYTIGPTIFAQLFGAAYPQFDSNKCFIAVTKPLSVPDTCNKRDTVGLSPVVICNSWGAAPPCDSTFPADSIQSSCPGSLSTEIVTANDDGNNHPINITSTLLQSGVNVTSKGLTACNGDFSIRYVLSNTDTNSTLATAGEKMLDTFSVYLNPAWIDISGFSITYGGNSVGHYFKGDTLKVPLSADTLFSSSSDTLLITGLKIDTPSSCATLSPGFTIGAGSLTYGTICKSDTYAVSSNGYENNLSYVPQGSAHGGEVSPGVASTLNFCLQSGSAGNPFLYLSDTLNFFRCDSILYSFTLVIPGQLQLLDTDTVYYSNGSDTLPVPLHTVSARTYTGVMPFNGAFPAEGCIYARVGLGDSCPSGTSPGDITSVLYLQAICKDTPSCQLPYCFAAIGAPVSVHCGGLCNSTGIGTDSMSITNDSAGTTRDSFAYACDVIDFKVYGTGYQHGPSPGSTNQIFLVLSYDTAAGTDTIFDTTGAIASYHHNGDSISIPTTAFSGPTDSAGRWWLKVPISNALVCDSIRSGPDTSFVIEVKLKVRCDLNYSGTGVYDLLPEAIMDYTAGAGDTLKKSCDNVAREFTVFDHRYGTSATFLNYVSGQNPCILSLLFEDSATGGLGNASEMPGLTRPLIIWPVYNGIATDSNTIKLEYGSDLTVEKIRYSDGDSVYSDSVYFGPTFGCATNHCTYVYGFKDSITGAYYWPASGKDKAVYFRQLLVTFNMGKCNESASVYLHHQLKDGKTATDCTQGCSQWLPASATSQVASTPDTVKVNWGVTFNQGYQSPDPLGTDTFTINLGVHPTTGIDTNNIWIQAQGQYQFGDSFYMEFPGVDTVLTNPFKAPADSFALTFLIRPAVGCGSFIADLFSYYTCPVPGNPDSIPSGGDCHSYDVPLHIYPLPPGLNLDTLSGSSYPAFNDCKGICCDEKKTWKLSIKNAGDATHNAYALNPIFSLSQQGGTGNALLDISEIKFIYYHSGSPVDSVDTLFPLSPPVHSFITSFDTPAISHLILPDTNNFFVTDKLPELPLNDSIVVIVSLYGDEHSCGWSRNLQAGASCTSICGYPFPAPGSPAINRQISYSFRLDSCNTLCTGDSFCLPHDSVSECNSCQGATPITITAFPKNASCGGGATGSIHLRVNGGPLTVTIINGIPHFSLPTFLYNWSPAVGGGAGTDSVYDLSGGTYYVTVTDSAYSACFAIDTITIDSSGINITPSITQVLCYGGSNGAIALSVTPSTGNTFKWSNDSITQSISHLVANTYTVTVTNSTIPTACPDSTVMSFSVAQPSAITFSFDTQNVNCSNPASSGFILATASGGTGPLTFLWNTGVAFQGLYNLSTGVYSLTVTDSIGCSVAASDTIKAAGVFSSSKIVLAGNPCGADSILLWDSLPANLHPSYFWSTGQLTDSIKLPSQSFDVYSVTATLQNGCADTASLNISGFGIGLVFDTFISCTQLRATANFFGSDSSISAAGIPPYTFVFRNAADTSEIIGDITIDTTASPYTFNLIFPQHLTPDTSNIFAFISSSNGCFSVYEFTLNHDSFPACYPYDYCFTNPDTNIVGYFSDTILSDTLHVPPGSFIYFGPHTTLIIDSTFSFTNCEVVLGDSARIIVDAGDTLNILGSTLKGCDTMWAGILVEEGGSINVDSINGTRSIIEDAVEGIIMEGGHPGEDMLVRHTDFKKNEYSIVLYDYVPDNGSCDISDCYFGMDTFTHLLPAPHGQIATNRPVAGIVAQWPIPMDLTVGPDTLSIPNPTFGGGPNKFQYMNTGIYCINSPAKVFTNTFDSIRNYEAVNPWGFYGAAIVGSPNYHGRAGFNYLLVKTDSIGADSLSTVRFNNCDYGIKAQSYLLDAVNNRMENVTYGVYTKYCNHQVTVSSNYIHQTSYGVSLIDNSSARQTVSSNTIYVNPPILQWIPVATGHLVFDSIVIADTILGRVSLQTYGVEETEVTSSNTAIEYNTINGGLNAIVMNNTKSTLVKDNNLYITDATPVLARRAGLNATNCTGLYVSGNACYADSNYYDGQPNPYFYTFPSNYHKSGFSFYNCPNGFMCDNQAGGYTAKTGIGYGMFFAAYCDHMDVRSNSLNQNFYGITLQSSGFASILGDQGSLYQSQKNNFNGDSSGSFLGNYATASFYEDTFHFPTFYYDSTAPLTNPATDTATVNGISRPQARLRGTHTLSDSLFVLLCDIYRPLPFPIHLFRIGFLDSVIAQSNQKYYMEDSFSSTGPWLASKMLYESLYQDSAILDSNSLMYTFFTRMDSSDRGIILRSELENELLTDSADLVDTGQFSKDYSSAQSFSNGVPDSNIQAVNYKAMSNIYLRTIDAGVDTFTNGQLDTISALAVQCPYSAGDAVFIARALYAQYDNTIFFDDLAICTSNTGGERMLWVYSQPKDSVADTIAPKEYILVFPNPAKNILKIFYSSRTSSTMMFELSDLLGEVVIAKPIVANSTIELDVSDIASSMYLWRGRKGNIIIQKGKVSIQK